MDKIEIQSGTIYEEGFGIISKKVMKDKNLSIEAKAIYSYFCSYAGNGSNAYPGEKLICSDLGISRNRFYKYLRQLKGNGYIKIHKQKSEGKYLRSVYEMVIAPCTQIEDMENRYTNKNSLNKNNNVEKFKYHSRRKDGKPTKTQLKVIAQAAHIELINKAKKDA